MPGLRSTTAFRTDRDSFGRLLTPAEREKLLKPYLPPRPPSKQHPNGNSATQLSRQRRLRPFVLHLIHQLLFTLIHALFSLYIRLRQTYAAILGRVLAITYYHHRTPEYIQRDVQKLGKVPGHLSVILSLPRQDGRKGRRVGDEWKGGMVRSGDRDGVEALVSEACEVAAWSACAGIGFLSIYERTGALKTSLPYLHRRISRTLTSYYGNSPSKPTISVRAPHHPSYSPPHSPDLNDPGNATGSNRRPHLNILLLSSTDSRQTLVDLTGTLASMSQDGKLSPSDISTELIDAEISESVMGEPDLLIVFGERILLDGYPPWQVRLTEVYGVKDHKAGVGYQVFLGGLMRYAGAEMRLGR
ncbi:hypothetical protein LTR53_006783 [Teratosphaeriaceae sp. CCFEE 6253]|nr:hypothetical protein LTR53_006783 [Teratosphaeriaceae sp. CCFEE 6253]